MPTSAVELPAATKLAVDRTRLAHERTLMAWVRTSASLISFGFTIYKGLQYLRENAANPPPQHLIGPRGFGIGMISVGILALVLASIEHRLSLQQMRREYGPVPRSVAALVAFFLGAVGVVTLIVVAMNY